MLEGGETCDDSDALTENDVCTPGGLCAGTFIAGTCGAPIEALELPFDDSHTTSGQPSGIDSYGSDCGETDQSAADVAYEVNLLAGEELEVWLDPAADFDAVIRLIAACQNDEACLGVADDKGADGEELLTFTASEDMTVYVVIEGATADEDGDFDISIALLDAREGDIVADVSVDMSIDGVEEVEYISGCGCRTAHGSSDHRPMVIVALLTLGLFAIRSRF